MLEQIFLGTLITLVSVIFGALMWWGLGELIVRRRLWISQPPLALKTISLFCLVVVWMMVIMTFGVWLWAACFLQLETFTTMEEAVYYSLVAYTTLGLGDVIVPQEWRLLGGMTGANGFLVFGLLTAMLTDSIRDIRRLRGRPD